MNKKYMNLVSIVLGVYLILYVVNQFLHVFPTSYGKMPEFTQSYLDAIIPFLPALYLFEVIIGLMLIFNKWRPFVIIVLAPLSINFLIFNITNLIVNLQNESLINNLGKVWPAAFVAILNILLLIQFKEKYKPLFK